MKFNRDLMKQKLVLPGEQLSVEEEFGEGNNTFTGEEGRVYSAVLGIAEFDSKKRLVSVKPEKEVEPLEEGDIVYCTVSFVKDKNVVVKMMEAERDGKKKFISQSRAMISIMNVSRKFVKNLKDEFKIGDLIKARVARITPFLIDLKTNEPELGVLKAYCGKCKSDLHLMQGKLRCTNCGSMESRAYSQDYMLK